MFLVASFLLAATAQESSSGYSCPQLPPAGVAKSDPHFIGKPSIDGGAFRLVGGELVKHTGKVTKVLSPIYDIATGERVEIGSLPDMVVDEALAAVR